MQTRTSQGGPPQRAPPAAAESKLCVLLWRVAWSSPLAAVESASPEESLARLAALAGGDPRCRGGGAGAGCGQVRRSRCGEPPGGESNETEGWPEPGSVGKLDLGFQSWPGYPSTASQAWPCPKPYSAN